MIPIGDSPIARRVPWVTYAIILVNVAVFAWMLALDTSVAPTRVQRTSDLAAQTDGVCYGFVALPTEVDRFVCTFAFQPAEFFDTVAGDAPAGSQRPLAVIATAVTAIFLHAGWLHLIGNLFILYLAGPFVEDVWGRPLYAAFYAVCGVVAALSFAIPHLALTEPMVGASGATAGVMGAFAVRYAGTKVHMFWAFGLCRGLMVSCGI